MDFTQNQKYEILADSKKKRCPFDEASFFNFADRMV